MKSIKATEERKLEAARKVYDQLLTEAKEKFNEKTKKVAELSYNIHKARMMELVVSGSDEFLLEDEKLLLKKWELRWNQALKEYNFWKKRVEMLTEYDFEGFPAQLETKGDVDSFLSDVLSSSDLSNES